MRPVHSPLLLLSLFATLAACDGPADPEGRIPARVDVVSGDGQTGVAGAELAAPLVVRVLDERGRLVREQAVAFRVTSGGGSVDAGSARTDGDGVARGRWTLGTVAADSQAVEARAGEGAASGAPVLAVFRATATAGPAAALAAVGSTAKTGAAGALVADSPAVRVADQYGNPVAGAAVAWTTDGVSAVSSASVPTGADGVSRAGWTLPPRVDTSYTATASAGTLGSVAFGATAAAPPGAVLEKTSGDGQSVTAGTAPQPLVATVRLADGRPLRGAVVRFDSADVRSDAAGRAAYAAPVRTKVGTYAPVAAVQGIGSVTFSLVVTPGLPAHVLSGSAPWESIPWDPFRTYIPGPSAGATWRLSYTVTDAYFNPVPGIPLRFTVERASDGTVSPAEATTSAEGRAEARWTLYRDAYAWVRIPGTQVSTSFRPTLHPGPIQRVELSPDTLVLEVNGEWGKLQARAFDEYGNEAYENFYPYLDYYFWRFRIRNPSVAGPADHQGVSNFPTQGRAVVYPVAPGATWLVATFGGLAPSDSTYVIVR